MILILILPSKKPVVFLELYYDGVRKLNIVHRLLLSFKF